MRVLVACESSGVVRDAFLAQGHDAVSCDLKSTESPGPHHQGDVRELLARRQFDLLIAHPPCTYLARVSAPARSRDASRYTKMQAALCFVSFLWEQPITYICIENPYPLKDTNMWPPSQVIQPFYFGHPYTKATCLWLKRLPPLQPTNVLADVKRLPEQEKSWGYIASFSKDKAALRARTFSGIAAAMAEQWGSLTKPYGFF